MNAELSRATWRKAFRSQANGACVEVAALSGHRIAVRDSKAPSGSALIMRAGEWRAFLSRARATPSPQR